MSGSRKLVQALVHAFRSGEWSSEAEGILRLVVAKVFTALRRRFQSEDCEDGIAEGLLLLAQKPHAYREEEGSLEGFLYVVARNAVTRFLRQRARCLTADPQTLAAAVLDPKPSDVEEQEPHQPAELPAVIEEKRQLLAQKVNTLPAEKRAILLEFAAAQEGQPWATEYARRTGDNPNRVRVCLHRLLAQLRKELGATEGSNNAGTPDA